MKTGKKDYYVYMVRCSDGTLYTGVARDIDRRVVEHNESSKGARYTHARRPVQLVYCETAQGRGAAQSREYAVRKLSRTQKEVLISIYKKNNPARKPD